MSDPIERQDAIEVVKRQLKIAWENWHETRPSAERIIEDLKELPSAQPALTCDGCRHVGTYDTDFPCSGCIRREKDYYEQER